MTQESYRKSLYELTSLILVRCPSCSQQARVTAPAVLQGTVTKENTRLTCVHCGYNVSGPEDPSSGQVLGAAVDPYFRQPLWLTISCCGQLLWAYNPEHLALLKQLVGARLRERNGLPPANKSLGSRLPRWMTAAGNRQKVLKAIGELEKM